MRELTIAGRRIADDEPCYVVAELGNNHGGDVQTAKQMIRAAQSCGASAVKFQMRHNATLYSPAMLAQPYEHEYSFGKTYGEHRAALELNVLELSQCCVAARGVGVPCFATVFDEISADRWKDLSMPAIKLASGSLTDTALQHAVAQMGAPIILSTGGGTMGDIDRAVETITRYTWDLALLHCTAAYPVTDYATLNLRCIETLRARYPELVIGWSGHVSGIAMAVQAYAYGARIIEQHFTLNRASKGTDHAFSLEPAGLRKLVRDLERAHQAAGDGIKRVYPCEIAPISKMRRTVVHGRLMIATDQERLHEVH